MGLGRYSWRQPKTLSASDQNKLRTNEFSTQLSNPCSENKTICGYELRDDKRGAKEKTQYDSARNAQEISGKRVVVSGRTGQRDTKFTRRPQMFKAFRLVQRCSISAIFFIRICLLNHARVRIYGVSLFVLNNDAY